MAGSVQSKIWSQKMLSDSAGEAEHNYHCPWLSKIKPSDSARASHSLQRGDFSGTSSKLNSRLEFYYSQTHSRDKYFWTHEDTPVERILCQAGAGRASSSVTYPCCYHQEVQEGKQ